MAESAVIGVPDPLKGEGDQGVCGVGAGHRPVGGGAAQHRGPRAA
ncbi:MAG: hypothetical protein R3A10_00755 [Caldilineaceae bacterium]